jgi:hypothetical protein
MKWFWLVMKISITLSALAFLIAVLRENRRARRRYQRMLDIQSTIMSGQYGKMPEFDAKSGQDARQQSKS